MNERIINKNKYRFLILKVIIENWIIINNNRSMNYLDRFKSYSLKILNKFYDKNDQLF